MLAAITTASLLGTSGHRVTVEVHVGPGLPGFSIVGLPDEICRESRDRVRAALLSSGLVWPNKRITVNLAPSGVRKSGTGLDLALAVGVLVAADAIPPAAVERFAFIGEVGLDGSVRPVAGMAPMAAAIGDSDIVVAQANVLEARVVSARMVRPVGRLDVLVAVLKGERAWPEEEPAAVVVEPPSPPDLTDVRGQPFARLALEVAAAGQHHLFLVGPPGAGKTMLAARLPGLLPPLTPARALEATMVHSAAGVPLPAGGLLRTPPFRAPHHTVSIVAMVGGGTAALRPGELSLAHTGVLFLDELGEFSPAVLDGLRQPLEEHEVRVSRARASVTMPADVLLVGATNPCPCGGGRPGQCECTESARARYLRRLSGPLLDRFDLRVGVERPGVDELLAMEGGEPSVIVRDRVAVARRRAAARGVLANGLLPASVLDDVAPLTASARQLLRKELERGRLSGRGLHRVRRVARTLADLDGDHEVIDDGAIATALQLRVDVAARARAAA
ncbi:MAG TPA: YifB family Mg chelatase-like AAA ATPase [Ilumatobacteraceae bacterium]